MSGYSIPKSAEVVSGSTDSDDDSEEKPVHKKGTKDSKDKEDVKDVKSLSKPLAAKGKYPTASDVELLLDSDESGGDVEPSSLSCRVAASGATKRQRIGGYLTPGTVGTLIPVTGMGGRPSTPLPFLVEDENTCSQIIAGVGIRDRFVLGEASRGARNAIRAPQVWSRTRLDVDALHFLFYQYHSATRKHMTWVVSDHPVRNMQFLSLDLSVVGDRILFASRDASLEHWATADETDIEETEAPLSSFTTSNVSSYIENMLISRVVKLQSVSITGYVTQTSFQFCMDIVEALFRRPGGRISCQCNWSPGVSRDVYEIGWKADNKISNLFEEMREATTKGPSRPQEFFLRLFPFMTRSTTGRLGRVCCHYAPNRGCPGDNSLWEILWECTDWKIDLYYKSLKRRYGSTCFRRVMSKPFPRRLI